MKSFKKRVDVVGVISTKLHSEVILAEFKDWRRAGRRACWQLADENANVQVIDDDGGCWSGCNGRVEMKR